MGDPIIERYGFLKYVVIIIDKYGIILCGRRGDVVKRRLGRCFGLNPFDNSFEGKSWTLTQANYVAILNFLIIEKHIIEKSEVLWDSNLRPQIVDHCDVQSMR